MVPERITWATNLHERISPSHDSWLNDYSTSSSLIRQMWDETLLIGLFGYTLQLITCDQWIRGEEKGVYGHKRKIDRM